MIGELPPLREVIRRHELSARKSLGQNFLLDLNLTGRIARAAAPLERRTVIEIGPGPGGLTRSLLTEGATRLVAVEKDSRALAALAEVQAASEGRLELVEADALATDLSAFAAGGPAKIVANLPYNIATALLLQWIRAETWPPWWEMLVLMFQREVAERIVAAPGEDSYGRLGVICGWRTEAKILFDVSPQAFVPPPKVTSSVVRLVPRKDPLPCRLGDLERVTQAAFGQRRKMLRQSLKSLGVEAGALLEAAGISPTARAEEIDVGGFVRLARALADLSR